LPTETFSNTSFDTKSEYKIDSPLGTEMIDPSKQRSSVSNKTSVGERASYLHTDTNQIATERDPLLSSYKSPTNIKRRHQSPTFHQQINNSSNQSMTTGQTGPSFHGSIPNSHSSQHNQQQQSYIPPLPGREQNLLRLDSIDSDANSHRKSNEKRLFQDDFRQQYYDERAARLLGDDRSGDAESSKVVEVPEEIYAVRKNALTVMEPLIHTSVSLQIKVSCKNIFNLLLAFLT